MLDKKLNNILNFLIDEIQPQKVILFGSRGKGISKPNSNYDLAIDSQIVTHRVKRILAEKIDEMAGLHKVDLVFLNEVDEGFNNIIISTGQIIYEQ